MSNERPSDEKLREQIKAEIAAGIAGFPLVCIDGVWAVDLRMEKPTTVTPEQMVAASIAAEQIVARSLVIRDDPKSAVQP